MLALTANDVERLLEEHLERGGQPPADFSPLPGIPTARYFDPDFAKLELEHVWLKTWLMVGCAGEWPEPGSYRLFERLGRSVIVIRGGDGAVRAFQNTCRHRGSPVVVEPEGTKAKLVCPYHGWTYADDGRLLALRQPRDFPCLDKAEKGLVPVRCEVWRGLVFVNFDAEAQPLGEHLASLESLAASFSFERFEVKCRHLFELECNWKIPVDNVLEVYHVGQLHARSIAQYLDGPSFTVGLRGNGHSEFFARKKSNNILAPELVLENVAGQMFEDYNICMKVFPNNFYLFDAPGFVYHNYWPVAPNRCVAEFVQCGVESVGIQYYLDMFRTIKPVLDEDWDLFPLIQRSLESGASAAMTLGYQERGLYWMQQEIDRRIGRERIPMQLRVPEVLTPDK